jgi:hypothetical protein
MGAATSDLYFRLTGLERPVDPFRDEAQPDTTVIAPPRPRREAGDSVESIGEDRRAQV